MHTPVMRMRPKVLTIQTVGPLHALNSSVIQDMVATDIRFPDKNTICLAK